MGPDFWRVISLFPDLAEFDDWENKFDIMIFQQNVSEIFTKSNFLVKLSLSFLIINIIIITLYF